MKKIILSVLVAGAVLAAKTTAKQVQTCVYPNKCEKPVIVAQVQPCVWPKCEKPVIVAQITTCQWPNKCEQSSVFGTI